jgi:hypothetical protein
MVLVGIIPKVIYLTYFQIAFFKSRHGFGVGLTTTYELMA